MVKKTCVHAHKEKGNQNREQVTLSDVITLRDEILDLKRQILILKRANEQYSVRLRRHEDEAKRKDRQLELLMDPRKNAEVAKVLSTKGAAILMNLKEQNNALIQMLLNRDLHIRRLVAENKMSKLYASTKKNEGYKAEISRLRNLLMKSEESLRENVEIQRKQMRSICVRRNPISEISSSSDRSSPRDLDELRSTILSLESHIKQSNDLLAQKNKEISILSDELNFFRKYFQYKTSKAEVFDFENSQSCKLSAKILTRSWPGPLTSNLSDEYLPKQLQEDQSKEYDHLSRSAPAGQTVFVSSVDSAAETDFSTTFAKRDNERSTLRAVDKQSEVLVMDGSIIHSKTANEILREKGLSAGKWKQALKRYNEVQKSNLVMTTTCDQNQNEISSTFLDSNGETFQNNLSANGKVKSEELLETAIQSASSTEKTDVSDNGLISESYLNSKNFPESENRTEKSNPSHELQTDEQKNKKSPSLAGEELKTSSPIDLENSTQRETNSWRDYYCQSLNSSFDSEKSHSIKPKFRQVQVEVQINSVAVENYTDQLENIICESRRVKEFGEEIDGNQITDLEFNDDDDVIIR